MRRLVYRFLMWPHACQVIYAAWVAIVVSAYHITYVLKWGHWPW